MIPLTAYWDRLEPLVKANTPDWRVVGADVEASMASLPTPRRHGVALVAAERVRHAWSLTTPTEGTDDPAVTSFVEDLDRLLDVAWLGLAGDTDADVEAAAAVVADRPPDELRRLDPLLHALHGWAGEAAEPTGFSLRYLAQRLVDFVWRTPPSIAEGRRAWREREFAKPGSAEQIEATVLGGSSPVPRRVVAWMTRDAALLADPDTVLLDGLRAHARHEVDVLLALSDGPLAAAEFAPDGPIETLDWPSGVTTEVEATLDRLDAELTA